MNKSQLLTDYGVSILLKEYFPAEDLLWRPGTKTKDGKKAMALAYVDARAIFDRLDAAVGPGNWASNVSPINIGNNSGAVAELSVRFPESGWVSRSDVSQETAVEAMKGSVSKSFVRVGAQFGIGRYIYDFPSQWCKLGKWGFEETPDAPKEFLPQHNGGQKISRHTKVDLDKLFSEAIENGADRDEVAKIYRDVGLVNYCPGRGALEVREDILNKLSNL
jgi:hypothetical protein